MRLFTSFIAAAAMLVMATSASAINVVARDIELNGSPVGNSIDALVGDVITIGVILDNEADGTQVQGMGVSAYGYDDGSGVVAFQSGVATDQKVLATNCFPGAGCFDGLDNLVLPSPGNLAESEIGTNGNRVQLLNLATTGAPGTGTGGIDFGIDGDGNTNVSQGDVHAQISFVVTGFGTTTILFGTGYEGDGVVLPDASIIQATGDSITISVIPEPGTALLMGLGLTGLAFAGRRS